MAFLKGFIFGKDAEGRNHSEFGERASMRGAAAKLLDRRIADVRSTDPQLADQLAEKLAFRDLQGLPGRDEPYKLFLHEKAAGLEAAAERISKSGVPVTPQELQAAAVQTYGGDPDTAVARMMAEAVANQTLAEPHIQGMVKGGQRLAAGIGEQLLADNPDPRLFSALGTTEDQLRQRWGTPVAGGAEAATAAAPPPPAAAAAVQSAEVPVGINSSLPSWLPRDQRMSDLHTGLAYSGLAAGGAAGLAALLMDRGQPQQDPYDYAAAVAAMNAYV
jgi:hypothetical protein